MIRKSSMLLLLFLVFVVAIVQFIYPMSVVLGNPSGIMSKVSSSEFVRITSQFFSGKSSKDS